MKQVSVLVTGSSGFIGRHLAGYLVDSGYNVAGLDVEPLQAAPWRTIECDIRDRDRLTAVLEEERPELVAHLAARTDLDGLTVEDYSSNIEGVAALLAAIDAVGSVRRCIFTSTQLVGPPGVRLPADDGYAPTTPYGASKAVGEQLVRTWRSPIEWCMVRPTTVWGPGMNAHYQRFFRHIRRGTYVHIGRRPLTKSYGYVGNTAFQYRSLLEADTALVDRRTFYLADYERIRLRDWVDALSRELNAPPVRTLPEAPARWLARAGDLMSRAGWSGIPFTSFRLNNIMTEYTVDTSALHAICGVLPYDQAAGVRATAEWLRQAELRASRSKMVGEAEWGC
jgi:GlcNAc-P-P-Und epimerase